MSKLTLNLLGNLLDTTTSQANINSNSQAIINAMENTLSRDGTSPNQMTSNIDMNSNQILNLPTPATNNSPLRLQDLVNFTGGGTVTNIPVGGTTNQVLSKNTATNYDTGWKSVVSSITAADASLNVSTVAGAASANINTANPNVWSGQQTMQSPVLITPNIGVATATSVNKVALTAPATSATLTLTDGTTVTGPAATGTLVTKTSTDTLTNKTFDTAGAGNSFSINGVAATANTGTGSVVRATTPTITTANLVGSATNDAAAAGSVGESVSASVVSGSAISLTTVTAANVTSISLTAGDWEISGAVYYTPGATTNVTIASSSTSSVSATNDTTPGKFNTIAYGSSGLVTGGGPISLMLPPFRLSLASTTTIFLVAFAGFTVSTLTAYGHVHARRMR